MQNKIKFRYPKRTYVLYSFILVFLMVGIPSTVLGQVYHSVIFERSDLKTATKKAENGKIYSKISIKDILHTDEVGKPSLPVKYIRLIVPSDQNFEEVILENIKEEKLPVSHPVFPTQPPINFNDRKPDFVEPDRSIYASDKPYPSEIVKVVHDGYFDGSNHILTVAVYPVQYQPASGRLTFFSSINFEIKMNAGRTRKTQVRRRTAKNQKIYNSILKSTVDNPQDVFMYQIKPSIIETTPIKKTKTRGSVPFYDYIVITCDSLKTCFDDFVSWKKRKGLDIGVVTTDSIYNNYSGDEISGIYDKAGSIRQYLYEAYQDGTVYALLGGFAFLPATGCSDTIVPVRYGTDGGYRQIPADLYFADFTGDWNCDDDEYYGEPEVNGDTVDYNPEIFVGRIPCRNSKDIANWTEKALKYEQNPGNGETEYLMSSFWLWGPNWPKIPDSIMITPHIPPGFEYTVWDQNPSHSAPDVVIEMNNHGLINWSAHGEPTCIHVRSAPFEYVWAMDDINSSISGDGLDCMTNNDYYSIVYSNSCYVAAFDGFDQEEGPPPIRCMAERWLFLDSICGPAFLGNSRAGVVSENDTIEGSEYLQMEFYDLLTLGTDSTDTYGYYLHLGISELISKLNYTGVYSHLLCYSHNLYGCPEMQIWTEEPSEFTSVSITDNDSNIVVNTGVSGCNICVCSIDNGETYYKVANNTSNYTFITSERPVYVTITKLNYLPYMMLLPTDLVLQNITVEIDSTKNYQAFNSITAAGDSTYFIVEGNGSAGGYCSMQAGNYIVLQSGFVAKSGCHFWAYNDNPVSSGAPLAIDYKPDKKTTEPETKKDEKEDIPKVFSCTQNYPNPFIRSTTINYGLPENSNVKLTIFNIAGQAVRTLVNGQESAGFKTARWNGRTDTGKEVPQGIYFYVFKAEDFEKHHKMILLK